MTRGMDKTVTCGMGIRDGRGYGPYSQGYFIDENGNEAPYGPNCELLTMRHDWPAGITPEAELVRAQRRPPVAHDAFNRPLPSWVDPATVDVYGKPLGPCSGPPLAVGGWHPPWFRPSPLPQRQLGGEEQTQQTKLSMSPNIRSLLLILGFGVSAALLFVTIYPHRQG